MKIVPFVIVAFSIFLSSIVNAQRIAYLAFSKPRKPRLSSFPFQHIRVLDTRVDTTSVYSDITGEYPRIYYTMAPSLSIAMEHTLDSLAAPLTKSGGTVLVAIRQFRKTNASFIRRRNASGRIYRYDLSNSLLVKCVFYENMLNGNYRPFGSFDYEDFAWGADFRKLGVFRKLLEAINRQYRDGSRTATTDIPFDSIASGVAQEWAQYPIMTDSSNATGIFPVFEDFSNDKRVDTSFGLSLTADSLYTLAFTNTQQRRYSLFPYAAIKDGRLYIQLEYNKYLPLHKDRKGFTLEFPSTLPNMYEWMALQANRSTSSSHARSSGNPLVDLAGTAVIGAVDLVSQNKRDKEIKAHPQPDTFRKARLDLYSGDFIF